METTLVLLKPDSLARGLVGDIIGRFERVGLTIVGLKMIQATDEILNQHYPTKRRQFIEGLGQKTLDNNQQDGLDSRAIFGSDDPYQIGLKIQAWTVQFMQTGPVIALALRGPGAIAIVRKIRGFTLPALADIGTITGDYSFDSATIANSAQRSVANLVHASGNPAEAKFEVGLWFSNQELFDYTNIHQQFMTQGP